MSQNRMVAVCDILGFGLLVSQIPLDKLVSRYRDVWANVLGHALKHGEVTSGQSSLYDIRAQKRVGVAWFSDTTLIYGLDDTDKACENVIVTLGWLLFDSIFTPESWKIRAGVSYGPFHADQDNEFFVGKSVVDAYRLERAQEWIGGALTHKAEARISKGNLPDAGFWIQEYPIPLKASFPDKDAIRVAINWTKGIHDQTDTNWSAKLAEPTHSDWAAAPDICRKWFHTREFHRAVCKTCDPDRYSDT